MRRERSLAGLAVVTVTPLVLASCSARATSSAPETPAASPSPRTVISATPPSSDPASAPSAAATSVAPSRPAAATPGPAGTHAVCRSADLQIDVLRGSGISGRQFASISFTNVGTGTCAMSGIPQVQLVQAGTPLDDPARATAKPTTVVTLAPGRAATTMVVDFSTCNASNSDAMRITPPGQTSTVDTPVVLRGCPLEVDPVAAAS